MSVRLKWSAELYLCWTLIINGALPDVILVIQQSNDINYLRVSSQPRHSDSLYRSGRPALISARILEKICTCPVEWDANQVWWHQNQSSTLSTVCGMNHQFDCPLSVCDCRMGFLNSPSWVKVGYDWPAIRSYLAHRPWTVSPYSKQV